MFFKYFFILINKFEENFKSQIILLFLMSVIGGVLELLGIAMIFPVMLILTSNNSGLENTIISKFFPHIKDMQIAIWLTIIMIGIFIFKNIYIIFLIKLQNDFVKKWTNSINDKIVKKLIWTPYKVISTLNYGEKITMFKVVREIAQSFVLRCIVFFANGVVALFIISLLFYKYTVSAFISTCFIFAFAYFENLYFKKKARKYGDIEINLLKDFSNDSNFIVSSEKEIAISNKQEFFASYINNSLRKIAQNDSMKNNYGSYPVYVTEIGIIITFLIMTGTIIFLDNTTKGELLSSLAVIALIILRLVPQLNKVLISMYHINLSKQSVIWFLSVYEKISKFEYENFKDLPKTPFEKEIELKNISYFHNDKKGIKNINLKIKKGEFIGIIGASGAGKTTLADVISGINIPNSGEFLIDNIKIEKENLVSWRKNISFLFQEPVFISGSVAKNVAFGEENYNIAKVKESLQTAGIEADLNLEADKLSVGQKHRVALARAYYKDCEVLILDEATAALDIETEFKVVQNILKLKGQKTIIAIAHRLSTLKKCDRIIYVKEGEIKDIGTFSELRERNFEVDKMLKVSSFD